MDMFIILMTKFFGLAGGTITGALVAGLVGVRVAEYNRRRDRLGKRAIVARALLTEMHSVTIRMFIFSKMVNSAIKKKDQVYMWKISAVIKHDDRAIYTGMGRDIGSLSNEALLLAVAYYRTMSDFCRRVEELSRDGREDRYAGEVWHILEPALALKAFAVSMRAVAEDVGKAGVPDGVEDLLHNVETWLCETRCA